MFGTDDQPGAPDWLKGLPEDTPRYVAPTDEDLKVDGATFWKPAEGQSLQGTFLGIRETDMKDDAGRPTKCMAVRKGADEIFEINLNRSLKGCLKSTGVKPGDAINVTCVKLVATRFANSTRIYSISKLS